MRPTYRSTLNLRDRSGGSEIGVPGWIHLITGGGVDPGISTWWPRLAVEAKTRLRRQPVALSDIAWPATGHNVVPGVVASLGTRKDVIQ
jgi:hypothetical protein